MYKFHCTIIYIRSVLSLCFSGHHGYLLRAALEMDPVLGPMAVKARDRG